jgi:hypothetical protein
VQKTEQFARLLHLSATGNVFVIVTALLMVVAVSLFAGEPAGKLTLANQPQLPAQTNLLSGSGSLPFDLKGSVPAMSRPEKAVAAEFSTDTQLEKPAHQSGQGDSFQLVHENRTSASRSNVSFSIQAGYERIWDDKSVLAKISAGHQETGCAYVRANFSF